MSEEWPEFVRTIFNAEILIHQKYATRNLDRVTLESMESVIAELHFLYIFVGYSHKWSDAASSSSSSSSHNTKMEPLFIKVATAAKEFTIYLQHAFIDRFTHEGFTTSELLHVFNSLDEKVALLKPEIREAYQVSLSTQSFHPQPPSSRTSNSSWNCFCLSLESNLQYLSEEKSLFLGNPLRKQMKVWEQSLRSLYWLLRSDHHIHDWSPWRDIIMAHLGGIVLQVAHLCCLCWYNAPVDQSTEKDMAINLSDLYQKMNSTTPDFLENTLGYLQQYDGEHIRVLKDERGIIQKELVTLIIGLTRIPKIHDVDVQRILVGIKDALLEARYLKDRDRGENKIYFAILFAKIWWLKAEIFFQSSDTLTLSLDDHVRALHEGYKFLEELFSPTDEKSVEYQIWKVIARVPWQVEYLYQSSDVKDYLVHVKVNHLLLKSLVHIMLLKAKSFFLELLQKDASLLLPLKHKIRTIHKGLFYMIEVVNSKAEENMKAEKLILQDIEVMATRLISLSNAFPVDNLTEAVVKNMDVWLLDLLEEDKHLKAKLKKFYLHTPMLNLPKTPGLCLIENVLQNFRDVLNHKHDLGTYVIHLIEAICEDLKFIISAFRDVFEQGFDIQELQNLHTRLIEAAYLAEYTMDLMVLENDAKRQQLVEVYHLSDEIKHIKLQIDNFCSNNTYGHGVHNNNVPQKLMPFVSQVNTTSTEEVMVGINDQKEAIIGRLTRGTLQRALVSIVGMPGIGKTTLANNVFCSPKVMYHFPIRAWCCVSQKYKKRDLLLDILSNIITITDDTHSMSDTDLDSLLYKQLKRKRYLIIMDDMWSTEAWDELQLSFSDDSNGSRILLTSRLQDVVSKISDPFPLRPLSVEESWELLKIKIFREEECPQELWEIGQKIAENCKGLPLAIGAIAGLLDRTNKNQDLWKQIAKSVSSSVVNDPETQCKEILELSYKHLPDHLKACFLYFGVFPEDKDIPVQKLQWLWIAEGFVRKLEFKSLEDLAEDYLMDLVGRSLVIVAKRRSNGKVKACRVHDVVRDLCLLKAKDDKFLQLISANDEPYSSFDHLDYVVHFEHFNPSNYIAYEEYRLCFCVNREYFVSSRPSGSFVRSLLHIATTDTYPRCPYDVAFISSNFKRLRVLDLESINMGISFANGIELLVHLRYLAICGDMESIPPFVSNLQNLEILVVKGLKRKVVLPETIWRMKKLRHVHVTNHAIFTLQHAKDGSSSLLNSLVSLSFLHFTCGEATNAMMMRFPNLRKLRCIAIEPRDVSMNLCQFPALESLCKLESLEISFHGKFLNTNKLNLPSSLKKLTLSNFRLPWSQISAIGRLPNLEVLKLIARAFEGSSWDMAEGEFVNLKYLKLDTLNIVHWDASSDHLPQLQQLVVQNCKQLKEIPFDFVSISTLQKIEVQQCGISVEESVKKIEEVEIEGLKVVINNSHSAERLSY